MSLGLRWLTSDTGRIIFKDDKAGPELVTLIQERRRPFELRLRLAHKALHDFGGSRDVVDKFETLASEDDCRLEVAGSGRGRVTILFAIELGCTCRKPIGWRLIENRAMLICNERSRTISSA